MVYRPLSVLGTCTLGMCAYIICILVAGFPLIIVVYLLLDHSFFFYFCVSLYFICQKNCDPLCDIIHKSSSESDRSTLRRYQESNWLLIPISCNVQSILGTKHPNFHFTWCWYPNQEPWSVHEQALQALNHPKGDQWTCHKNLSIRHPETSWPLSKIKGCQPTLRSEPLFARHWDGQSR